VSGVQLLGLVLCLLLLLLHLGAPNKSHLCRMTSQSCPSTIWYASSTTASGAHARSGWKPTNAHSIRIWDSKGI
jgi:hypothetical protein